MLPVRFLAAARSRDGLRAVPSCVAEIWTMKVDLAAAAVAKMTMTVLLNARE